MKHVIIAGPGRCGKTTLSMMLREKGLVHYKMDSIKRGIDNNFWNEYQSEWNVVSPKMAHLIGYIIKEQLSDIIKDTEYYVIDTCHLYPKDIYEQKLENTIIVFMGFADISAQEKLKIVREKDIGVWTSNKSDESLLISLQSGIDYSKEAKEQCKKYGYKYFDTSSDFLNTINEAYKYIESELENE